MGRYEVDAKSQSIREVSNACANPADSKFFGAFDADESKEWRFIPAAEKKQMPMSVDGCPGEI
jgi:hypothetical protein